MAVLSDYEKALSQFEKTAFATTSELDCAYKALDNLIREIEVESERYSAIASHHRANSHHLSEAV